LYILSWLKRRFYPLYEQKEIIPLYPLNFRGWTIFFPSQFPNSKSKKNKVIIILKKDTENVDWLNDN
jgi:hypothetical protein